MYIYRNAYNIIVRVYHELFDFERFLFDPSPIFFSLIFRQNLFQAFKPQATSWWVAGTGVGRRQRNLLGRNARRCEGGCQSLKISRWKMIYFGSGDTIFICCKISNYNLELYELCWIYWKCLIAENLFVKYFITSVPDPEGRRKGQETSGEEGKKFLVQFIHSSVMYMSQMGIMRPNWDG